MTLCSIGVVARQYGVSASTIRRWAAKGLLTVALRTLGGHRRFELDNASLSDDSKDRKHVGYARVSSHDQKEDLQRQAQRLKSSGCEEVITDIGSGLNCNKPGLKSLLNRILQGKVHTLSVVYEDRLLRFGVKAGGDINLKKKSSHVFYSSVSIVALSRFNQPEKEKCSPIKIALPIRTSSPGTASENSERSQNCQATEQWFVQLSPSRLSSTVKKLNRFWQLSASSDSTSSTFSGNVSTGYFASETIGAHPEIGLSMSTTSPLSDCRRVTGKWRCRQAQP